jgi:hypothetical protein
MTRLSLFIRKPIAFVAVGGVAVSAAILAVVEITARNTSTRLSIHPQTMTLEQSPEPSLSPSLALATLAPTPAATREAKKVVPRTMPSASSPSITPYSSPPSPVPWNSGSIPPSSSIWRPKNYLRANCYNTQSNYSPDGFTVTGQNFTPDAQGTWGIRDDSSNSTPAYHSFPPYMMIANWQADSSGSWTSGGGERLNSGKYYVDAFDHSGALLATADFTCP